jgi:uncharacterized protein GlcG (DUF336 family)
LQQGWKYALHDAATVKPPRYGGLLFIRYILPAVGIAVAYAGRSFMSHMSNALAGIGISLIVCGSVSAQGVVVQRNLSLALARTIADATLAECKAKGFNTSAAVVDRAGQVLVILRDEQASAQTAEMARRKAYTAWAFRTTTLEFQKRTAGDPTLAAQRDVADILALGGGIPIRVGSDTIGGVGSSGSSQDQDDACAKAGVAKAADLLK